MSVEQDFLTVGFAIGLICILAVIVVALAKSHRTRAAATSRKMLAPCRSSLIIVVAGEDEDGAALAALCALPSAIWVRFRPSVIAFLPKVRGAPATHLEELMRSHGEIDGAISMLTSRSAIRRASAAYLLGLVRDRQSATRVLPLLSDHDADVRLVAARALGFMGDPAAAGSVLQALRTRHGQIGLPAWVAAEALLSMGPEIGKLLQIGLTSQDPAVRKVCTLVAGHGLHLSTAPQLRVLLATDIDRDVRVSAAVALGRVGNARDAAILVRHTDASEPAVLRRTCVTALGDLGQSESFATLAALLSDDDRRLATQAADSLVRNGSEGIAILQSAVSAQRGPGAHAAAAALELAGLRRRLAVGSTGPP